MVVLLLLFFLFFFFFLLLFFDAFDEGTAQGLDIDLNGNVMNFGKACQGLVVVPGLSIHHMIAGLFPSTRRGYGRTIARLFLQSLDIGGLRLVTLAFPLVMRRVLRNDEKDTIHGPRTVWVDGVVFAAIGQPHVGDTFVQIIVFATPSLKLKIHTIDTGPILNVHCHGTSHNGGILERKV